MGFTYSKADNNNAPTASIPFTSPRPVLESDRRDLGKYSPHLEALSQDWVCVFDVYPFSFY